jgi:hypothetical protein
MRTLSDRQQRGVAAAGLLFFAGVLCFLPPGGVLSTYVIGVLAGAGACAIWRTPGDRKDAMPGASVRGRAGG